MTVQLELLRLIAKEALPEKIGAKFVGPGNSCSRNSNQELANRHFGY